MASPSQTAGRSGRSSGPRLRPEELDVQRERRVRFATYLLGAALMLGIAWMGVYLTAAFPAQGVPSGLVGQVVDATTDEAIVNATLTVDGTNLSTVTDAAGNFSLPGVPSGPISLHIVAPGYKDTTFALYITPPPASGNSSYYNGFRMELERGSGPSFQDAVGPRTASVGTCLAIFAIGIVMNALGFMAVRTRRRYGHAVLGAVGAFLSIGFYVGPILGLLSYVLVRGARDKFADTGSLFAPGSGPRLYDEDDEDDDEEDAEDGENAKADGGAEAPDASPPGDEETAPREPAADAPPKGDSP